MAGGAELLRLVAEWCRGFSTFQGFLGRDVRSTTQTPLLTNMTLGFDETKVTELRESSEPGDTGAVRSDAAKTP